MQVVLNRRARVDRKIDPQVEFSITGSDISSKDNGSLSQAAYYMINVLSDLKDRNLIANDEFLRVIYRFFGETVDAEDMLKKARSRSTRNRARPRPRRINRMGPNDTKLPPIDDGFKDKTPIPKVGK